MKIKFPIKIENKIHAGADLYYKDKEVIFGQKYIIVKNSKKQNKKVAKEVIKSE